MNKHILTKANELILSFDNIESFELGITSYEPQNDHHTKEYLRISFNNGITKLYKYNWYIDSFEFIKKHII